MREAERDPIVLAFSGTCRYRVIPPPMAPSMQMGPRGHLAFWRWLGPQDPRNGPEEEEPGPRQCRPVNTKRSGGIGGAIDGLGLLSRKTMNKPRPVDSAEF
jgi:hypothetical protein